MYKSYFKRIFDFLGALILLPFIILLCIIVGPLIYFEDKGTIFYMAKRRGLNGCVFEMYKFRSMKMNAPDIRNADNSTYNSPDDPRITKVGKFLRKTSIDELPQIINVLIGDMSFIGPRASIPKIGYTWKNLNAIQKKRLTVLPGITGYTAALYRNSVSVEEKQRLDCFYVDNLTLMMDVKIIIWTIKTVLLRKNVYRN